MLFSCFCLHQLWCSLAPSWAPSAIQNQSTVSWWFCELSWLPRGPGEPGAVQGGWLGGKGKAVGEQGATPALGRLRAARAARLLAPLSCPLPQKKPPNIPKQGQRVSLFGSSTEETQVSRRILYSFVSSDFDLTMGCDALSTRY